MRERIRYLLSFCIACTFIAPAFAQYKYTDKTLPGNYWNVNNDLNEQWQAVQSFLRSGLEAYNLFPQVLKPTSYAWSECYLTDCSTYVQVPPPYCTVDCIGTGYCSIGAVDPGGMYSSACCELDPFAQTWIRGANEASLNMPFCPGYRQQYVDRFVSYCDFHPPYTNQSLFGCSLESVPRFYANHTYFDTWISFNQGAIDAVPSTTNNLITSLSIQYYDDIFVPGNSASGPEKWSNGYYNVTDLKTQPGPYNSAWRFAMVPELLCLPLEEINTEDIVWQPFYDIEHDSAVSDLATADAAVPNCTQLGLDRISHPRCKSSLYSSNVGYFAYYDFEQTSAFFQSTVLNTGAWGVSKGSLNPQIAQRSSFHSLCNFHPLMEHHASRWGPYSYNVNTSNVEFPGRKFLPDTLKRLSVTRSSKPYPVGMDLPSTLQGPLPWQWASFSQLEILNLSDATGNGSITGGLPHQWVSISPSFFAQYNKTGSSDPTVASATINAVYNLIRENIDPLWQSLGPSLSKIKVIDVRGHPNFCRDWHRKFLFDILNITLSVNDLLSKATKLDMNLFKEANWQKIWMWQDDQGNSGPVEILSDGKCCWGNGDYGNVDAATRRSNNYGGTNSTANPFANTTSYYGVDFGNAILSQWYMPLQQFSLPVHHQSLR